MASCGSAPARELDAACEAQCYRIALEAIANAMRHSGGATVHACLCYRADAFVLTVRDDGAGMPEALVRQGRGGHFGLQGMRERAADIGAQFKIAGASEGGTLVELQAPARRAYEVLQLA